VSGFPYQATDLAAFLDRGERLLAALHGKVLVVADLAAILNEVETLPWVTGRRYRLRVMAGTPTRPRVLRGHDKAGAYHEIIVPEAKDYQWIEFEAEALRREPSAYRDAPGPMLFRLTDGTTALLTEGDIWSAEAVLDA
jgi:hypothetical protein